MAGAAFAATPLGYNMDFASGLGGWAGTSGSGWTQTTSSSCTSDGFATLSTGSTVKQVGIDVDGGEDYTLHLEVPNHSPVVSAAVYFYDENGGYEGAMSTIHYFQAWNCNTHDTWVTGEAPADAVEARVVLSKPYGSTTAYVDAAYLFDAIPIPGA